MPGATGPGQGGQQSLGARVEVVVRDVFHMYPEAAGLVVFFIDAASHRVVGWIKLQCDDIADLLGKEHIGGALELLRLQAERTPEAVDRRFRDSRRLGHGTVAPVRGAPRRPGRERLRHESTVCWLVRTRSVTVLSLKPSPRRTSLAGLLRASASSSVQAPLLTASGFSGHPFVRAVPSFRCRATHCFIFPLVSGTEARINAVHTHSVTRFRQVKMGVSCIRWTPGGTNRMMCKEGRFGTLSRVGECFCATDCAITAGGASQQRSEWRAHR